MAIASRMTSQIDGVDQAARNANDGISLSQTAEGALATSSSILQNIRTLAVQASNASNSASDRQALQQEVNQLTAELNQIAQTTQFNGQNLLDGSTGTQNFQVGPNANQLIQTSGANFLTNNYGDYRVQSAAADVTGTTNAAAAGGSTIIAGYLGSTTLTTSATDTAKSIAANINATVSSLTGVSATAVTNTNLTMDSGSSYSFNITSDNATAVTVSFTVGAGQTSSDYASAVSAFNALSSKTGVTAQYDAKNGGIEITNATGNDITINDSAANSNGNIAMANYTTAGGLGTANATRGAIGVANGQVTLDSTGSFSVTDTSGLKIDGGATLGATLHAVSTLDVTTFANSQLALSIVDAALATVNAQRSTYGAMQSRFQSSITNLQTTAVNLSASRSRIQDTNYAAETANLTRGQILQQAGTAMLAQANAMPNSVLTLLK
ncbi:B-type flagellin [mine drainage metagenome]|uniref:B-type flagellin n=1 Tax=mine drainage metagenome TaxID=410659 RepID=A0A1J5QE59_9ZZZZ